MIFLVLAVLFMAGILLTKRGLHPARLGGEPRCRTCEYQLQGIVSDRCPECGTDLTPANTVHGHRQRRTLMGSLGVVLLLLAITGGVVVAIGSIANIDWYRYRPTSWLIDDLTLSSSRTIPTRAWAELNRRIGMGDLSTNQLQRLADQCVGLLPARGVSNGDPAWAELMRQDSAGVLGEPQRLKLIDVTLQLQQSPVAPTMVIGTNGPFEWITDQMLADKLTPARREAFLSHLFLARLVARPQIANGAILPYSLLQTGRGPASRLWYGYEIGPVLIDNVSIKTTSGAGGSSSSFSSGGSTGSSVATDRAKLSPGKHMLAVGMHVRFHQGKLQPRSDNATDPAIWEQTTRYEAPFTVLPPGTVDSIEMVSDPATDAAMQGAFSVTRLERPSYQGSKGLELSLNYVKPPANWAFNLFAVIQGKECLVGSVYGNGSANGTGSWGVTGGDFDVGNLTAVDLILRSNEDVARRSVGLTKIWKGEIQFKGMPILPSK